MEKDVEAQQPESPRSPRSAVGRFSWKPQTSGRKSNLDGDGRINASSSMNRQGSSSTPKRVDHASKKIPRSSTLTHYSPGRSGATIFNTQDKPDLKMMESYAVHRSATDGMANLRREGSFNRALFRSPTLLLQRSRSQKRSSTQISGRRRSIGKSHIEVQTVSSPTENEDTEIELATGGSTSNNAILEEHHLESHPTNTNTEHEESQNQPLRSITSAATTTVKPLRQKLSEFHAKHPDLKSLPMPLLPIVAFPGQGTGNMSEFQQEAPIWSRQPYKILYFIYFGLSVGLVFLPWFAIVSIFPSKRQRPSWTWKKSTLIKLYRHGTRLTFRTHTSLSRDLTKEVPHSKTVRAKFVWVEGLPDDMVRGQLKRMLEIQGLSTTRTCGFWYGERDGGGGVGQKAAPGEKLVYHLHGGAYWIGTAHEDDVTSAVNMQVLRALDRIYSGRLPSKKDDGKVDIQARSGKPSPHPPSGGPGAGSGGVCKRAFSLDYRLCVPGMPEVGSFPAPLADAVAGYRYLVNECEFEPENIIVAGDSAGGNLALALCRYLRDEKLDDLRMPGAMLLLSPWADTSRSHSGPLACPNKLSTVWLNRKSDIIANSAAFRNTAVSAVLGKMEARETYRNPYLSSISLQLDSKDGGTGPSYGFDGFPKRIFICTGTAEISYDQHLTLAFRLAAGTKNRIPFFVGDKCSENADPYEMAARLQYPRPDNHEVTIWPSAQNSPVNEIPPVLQNEKKDEKIEQMQQQGVGLLKQGKTMGDYAYDTIKPALQAVNIRLKNADGYKSPEIRIDKSSDESNNGSKSSSSGCERVDGNANSYEAGEGKNMTKVKEKDTAKGAHITHSEARRQDEDNSSPEQISQFPTSSSDNNYAQYGDTPDQMDRTRHLLTVQKTLSTPASQMAFESATHSQSYFDLGSEDRTVILDECIDAIHDYTLFDWFEPQRGHTWARIAKWIDEDV